jgi:hypothetical protein
MVIIVLLPTVISITIGPPREITTHILAQQERGRLNMERVQGMDQAAQAATEADTTASTDAKRTSPEVLERVASLAASLGAEIGAATDAD